jgi:hypothetical protein
MTSSARPPKNTSTTQLRSAHLVLKGPMRIARALWRRLAFKSVNYAPRGPFSIYAGYYPDGFPPSQAVVNLYQRWTRGNQLNNNGDAPRFIALILNLRQLLTEGIEGDFAELGVWKGNSAAILADFASKSDRKLFLFDTFSGFDQRDIVGIDQKESPKFADTSIDYVKETVGHPGNTIYLPGFFPETITDEVSNSRFAFVHLDCDLYAPMKAALEFFYPRLSKGGMLVMHDYSSAWWEGAMRAVDEFCQETGEFVSLWPDKSGTAMIRKTK